MLLITKKETFNLLQYKLSQGRVLYYFDRNSVLYIQLDTALKRGFGAIIFYLKNNYDWNPRTLISATTTQPIIFISKALTKRELLYGPSEFKIAYLAQVINKIRVKLYSSKYPVVVLTDYGAIKGIIKRTTIITSSVDRANRRLINASIYLSEYNLKIYHIPGKKNIVPDALSRLLTKFSPKE